MTALKVGEELVAKEDHTRRVTVTHVEISDGAGYVSYRLSRLTNLGWQRTVAGFLSEFEPPKDQLTATAVLAIKEAEERTCRQAYLDKYHKVKAEVSYDEWRSIWNFIKARL